MKEKSLLGDLPDLVSPLKKQQRSSTDENGNKTSSSNSIKDKDVFKKSYSRSGNNKSSPIKVVKPTTSSNNKSKSSSSTTFPSKTGKAKSKSVNKAARSIPLTAIPQKYKCEISHKLLIHPVLTSTGHIFDEKLIKDWFD